MVATKTKPPYTAKQIAEALALYERRETVKRELAAEESRAARFQGALKTVELFFDSLDPEYRFKTLARLANQSQEKHSQSEWDLDDDGPRPGYAEAREAVLEALYS